MRGVETRIQEIRHRVFREVARMAYHTEWPVDKRIESLPYKIIPGEVGNFRNDVFLERAIVGERLRLAMGLPCRSAAEHAPLSENIEAADRPETYYTPPLINVIKFACNGCAEKRVLVTEGCQGCLAHPCEEVCPKDAIKLDRYNGRSHIDPGDRVIAAVAPAFVGQFGPKVTPGKLRAAVKQLGFADVFEVAIGADLCATQEAEDFVREVPEELPFMGTSCCPAWSVMAKKLHPDHAHCISMALTPMTLTARLIKHEHPNAKVVFIGPCAAKKLEAMRKSVRSEVDFVLTFEEMAGIFAAKHVDLTTIEEDPDGVNDASTDGRSFAVGGGVAKAVVNVIQHRYPGREVKVTSSQGLRECRKMMQEAVAGKYPGYLLEGMACPGGCVAGAGTMQPIKKSQAAVGLYARQAKHKTSDETEHIKELDKLVD